MGIIPYLERRTQNGLRYDISFNLADNFSKITKFSSNEKKLFGKDNAGNERYYVGQTLGEIWGFDTDGIYQSEEEVKPVPTKVLYILENGNRETSDIKIWTETAKSLTEKEPPLIPATRR